MNLTKKVEVELARYGLFMTVFDRTGLWSASITFREPDGNHVPIKLLVSKKDRFTPASTDPLGFVTDPDEQDKAAALVLVDLQTLLRRSGRRPLSEDRPLIRVRDDEDLQQLVSDLANVTGTDVWGEQDTPLTREENIRALRTLCLTIAEADILLPPNDASTNIEIEIQDSGERFTVDGDDAQDAILNWARSQTLEWWRERGAGLTVLASGIRFHVGVDYDLECFPLPSLLPPIVS